MKIVVDIPETLLSRIKKRIEIGEFASVASFFYFAAENQLALQDTDELLTAEQDEFDGAHEEQQPYPHRTKGKLHDRENSEPIRSLRPLTPDWQKAARLQSYEVLSQVPQSTSCLLISGQEDMLWGQINRMFPVKFATRILANLQADEHGEVIGLDHFLNFASDVAAEFTKHAENVDAHEKRSRDERIATGFPSAQRGEKEIGKSISRYKNQFLVYLRRKTGDISGALAQLGLVCVSGENDKDLYIGLTACGTEFAALENPILDQNRTDAIFSSLERDVYCRLLADNMPHELQATCLLLSFINRGLTNRAALNDALRAEWPNSWSDAVVNTQRSGLTARLNEFGLIDKEKRGIEVIYRVTAEGLSFMNKFCSSDQG